MRANVLKMMTVVTVSALAVPFAYGQEAATQAGDGAATTTQSSSVTQPATTAPAGEAAEDNDLIPISLPENLELKTLAEAVARELKINILYDEQIANQQITVRVPNQMSRSSLLWLLDSALQMKGLVLVDAGKPGWKKITRPQGGLAAVSEPATREAVSSGVVTQLFNLEHADAARVADVVRPFISTAPASGNVFAVTGTRQLVVSDFAPVVQRVASIIEWLDDAGADVTVQQVALKRARASDMLQTVQTALKNKEQAQFGQGTPERVFLAADERTNQLILVGPKGHIAEAMELIDKLDQPLEMTTKVYRFRAVSPDTVDVLFQDILGEGPELEFYRSSVSDEAGALVVSTTADLHKQLQELADELDIVGEQSPLQFYKLRNAVAADVLATIEGLAGEDGGLGGSISMDVDGTGLVGTSSTSGLTGSTSGVNTGGSVGSNLSPGGTNFGGSMNGGVSPSTFTRGMPPSNIPFQQSGSQFNAGGTSGGMDNTSGTGRRRSGGRNSRALSGSGGEMSGFGATGNRGVLESGGRRGGTQSVGSVRTGNSIVTADINTNSIIVMAPPPVQKLYEELIKKLDVRRPQVQIECTIATLDTSNGLTFGVDIANVGGFDNGDGQVLTFSSNGLSTFEEGRLSPAFGRGINVAILNPEIADVVIRALASSSRSRLTSMPQILVNDNEEGSLQSIQEVPYTSIVRDDTDTTSETVGGFVEAGTAILVTPHISEDDYLTVDYAIELSSFGQQPDPNLPPPTQRNNISSSVTVPDGHTIVVGGLSTKSLTEALSGIPVLRKIPILGHLFSTTRKDQADTTLFIFIRPAILRDDKFRDLKFYSDRAIERAGVPGDFPTSDPILMH